MQGVCLLCMEGCTLVRSPLGMKGPPAGVHKAADAKASCCSRLLALLHTRHILSN